MSPSRWVLALVLVLAGCTGTITVGEGGPGGSPKVDAPGVPPLPAPSACSTGVRGRSYLGLAGEVLEKGRLDLDPAFDRLRPLPNPNLNNAWIVLELIQRSVGGDVHSTPLSGDPSVGNTFGNVPPRWYDEADVGAFSLSLSFNFAFESCVYSFERQRTYWNVTNWFELTDVMPTLETAPKFCRSAVTSALGRMPRDFELAGCVSTLMDVVALGEETEPRRVWAYGCAYAIATPMYLTY